MTAAEPEAQLRQGVHSALTRLGCAVLAHPANTWLVDGLRDGSIRDVDLLRALQGLVYQVVIGLAAQECGEVGGPPPRARTVAACGQRPPSGVARWRAAHVRGLFQVGSVVGQRSAELLPGAELAEADLLAVVRGMAATGPAWAASVPRDGFAQSVTASLGGIHESLLDLRPQLDLDRLQFALVKPEGRRRRPGGSHYTPAGLVDALLDQTLSPIVDRAIGGSASPADARRRLLGITVCDPSCGAGTFLLAAARRLALQVAQLGTGGRAPDPVELRAAMRDVVTHCIYGVDLDDLAVELTRAALRLDLGCGARGLASLQRHIRVGDSLLGSCSAKPGTFHWARDFPEVLAGGGGFSCIVGNPPWIAHAGRAAQPLSAELRATYRANFAAFARYATTHGCFLELSVRLTAQDGATGLILPTSVADLAGYAPTRAAVRAAGGVAVEPITNFGDGAFRGVFQPAMALVVRRPEARAEPDGGTWTLARDDLDPTAAGLLHRLAKLPTLPPESFFDVGLQTDRRTRPALRPVGSSGEPAAPIREGRDVEAFRAHVPRLEIPTRIMGAQHRSAGAPMLLRQTARFPVAAANDGTAFRNSLLGVRPLPGLGVAGTLAYLNSRLIRWVHHQRNRDAREGMPQVKLAHLRALPGLSPTSGAVAGLREAGAILMGDPLDRAAWAELDNIICDAFALCCAERGVLDAWAQVWLRQ